MNSKLIDPKLDEIPADDIKLTDAERAVRAKQKPARGLSINDTIARDANLSVGARGVDTSDVETGEPKDANPALDTAKDKLNR